MYTSLLLCHQLQMRRQRWQTAGLTCPKQQGRAFGNQPQLIVVGALPSRAASDWERSAKPACRCRVIKFNKAKSLSCDPDLTSTVSSRKVPLRAHSSVAAVGRARREGSGLGAGSLSGSGRFLRLRQRVGRRPYLGDRLGDRGRRRRSGRRPPGSGTRRRASRSPRPREPRAGGAPRRPRPDR